MNYPITHMIVRETPPPNQTQVVGHMWNPMAPAFKTYVPDYAPNRDTLSELDELDDEQDAEDAEAEAKVVRGRRGRRPAQANEAAETK